MTIILDSFRKKRCCRQIFWPPHTVPDFIKRSPVVRDLRVLFGAELSTREHNVAYITDVLFPPARLRSFRPPLARSTQFSFTLRVRPKLAAHACCSQYLGLGLAQAASKKICGRSATARGVFNSSPVEHRTFVTAYVCRQVTCCQSLVTVLRCRIKYCEFYLSNVTRYIYFVTLQVCLLDNFHFYPVEQEALLSQRGRAMRVAACLSVVSFVASIVQYLERSFLLLVTSVSDLLVHTIRFYSVVFGVKSSLAVIHTIYRDCV